MVRVLVNLITNAVDAMPDGGRLQITSTYGESSFGEFVKLCVSDTGAGIDENTLHKICEPFFTTKTRGTGLGLALCRKIIDAHKGSLNIRSKLNEGTTVEIFLPVEPGNHE
jgi:signal transduction histidine kinase